MEAEANSIRSANTNIASDISDVNKKTAITRNDLLYLYFIAIECAWKTENSQFTHFTCKYAIK